MTKEEFFTKVAGINMPSWRLGQILFNSLCNDREDLSEQIRATDKDPFYARTVDDPRYVRAVEFINENW